MHGPKAPFHFLVILVVLMLAVTFFILKPFIYPLILAGACAVVFHAPYLRARHFAWGNESVGAAIVTAFVLLAIVVPVALIGGRMFTEAAGVYASVADGGQANAFYAAAQDFALRTLSIDIGEYAKAGAGWIAGHAGTIFSGAVKLSVDALVFVMALYYALKDGHRLKRAFVVLSPLADEDDEQIARTLAKAVHAVVVGRLATALIQGLLAMAGFAAFGVPNAVLWGSVTALTALIPGIGTALTVAPAAAYLYAGGHSFAAAGLAIWGTAFVGLVDNFIGPRLIGRGIAIHPFLILLSVLGGIAFFGPAGFVAGPLAVSLLFALLETYRREAAAH